jgi:excisionase family DNA binding protein
MDFRKLVSGDGVDRGAGAVGEDGSGEAAALLRQLLHRVDRIEAKLEDLVTQKAVKEWYTVPEAAALLNREKFTVREWCRLGRVRAEKMEAGRGPASEWLIPHAELVRYRNEGLLPERK